MSTSSSHAHLFSEHFFFYKIEFIFSIILKKQPCKQQRLVQLQQQRRLRQPHLHRQLQLQQHQVQAKIFLLARLESANSSILALRRLLRGDGEKIRILCKLGFLMPMTSLVVVGSINQSESMLMMSLAVVWSISQSES